MKLKLYSFATLALCTSLASNAAESGDVGTMAIANRFVDALQHQHYKQAAALFAHGGLEDISPTEHTLKRIGDSLGGFATIHPIGTLPDGKTVKLDVGARQNGPLKVQEFVQVRYVSTASDGQPVFYELNLNADGTPSKILSFALHFPATDTQSSKRANLLVAAINH